MKNEADYFKQGDKQCHRLAEQRFKLKTVLKVILFIFLKWISENSWFEMLRIGLKGHNFRKLKPTNKYQKFAEMLIYFRSNLNIKSINVSICKTTQRNLKTSGASGCFQQPKLKNEDRL